MRRDITDKKTPELILEQAQFRRQVWLVHARLQSEDAPIKPYTGSIVTGVFRELLTKQCRWALS